MRPTAVLTLLLTAGAPAALTAQVDYYARVGVTWASDLLTDRIINDISVGQALAPTLALGAALPIAPRYRAGLEATLISGGFDARESGTADADLGTLRAGSLLLGLDGPVAERLRWRAGVGLLRYWPSQDTGMFARGGATRFLVGAGADYRVPVLTHWDLMASARWDFHRFTTEELRARGFGSTQGVQRVSVTVGLARGGR